MRNVFLAVLLCCGLLPLGAAEDPFVPAALNGILPNIRSGMTVTEVKAALKPAYPDVKELGGEWSGKVGCFAFMLDERYTLCVGAVVQNCKLPREIVANKLRFDVTDRLRKRRIDVSVSD